MFFIVQKIPGDPARAAAGQGATKERIIEIRKEFGLDLPVHVQIYRYFGRILNLDLGKVSRKIFRLKFSTKSILTDQ